MHHHLAYRLSSRPVFVLSPDRTPFVAEGMHLRCLGIESRREEMLQGVDLTST
jgi:hypothetical protein